MLGMEFVDLKQAFDTVDRRVLCNKLKLYRQITYISKFHRKSIYNNILV